MGQSIHELGISKEDFDAFRHRLMQEADSTLIKAQTQAQQNLILIGHYQHRLRAFVLSAMQHQWPSALDQAMSDIYGLSQSEREVLACLAQGISVEDISAQRNRAIGTVRQQIKSLLHKLAAKSQIQAATMAAAAAAALNKETPGTTGNTLPSYSDSDLRTHEFIHQGRRIAYRSFGDPKGIPVILIHGPFFGAGDYDQDRKLAQLMGLAVYALERSGYGRTAIASQTESALERNLSDLEALIRHRAIEPKLIISHEVGLVIALALAAKHPNWVPGILAISAAPPFKELQQIESMPAQQRIFIWAAQKTPWMVRLLIRLGMVRLRKLGPDQWHQAVFGEIQHEMAALGEPSLQAGHIAVYSYNINQTGAGFMEDLQISVSDWGHLLHQYQGQLVLAHGELNQMVRSSSLNIIQLLCPHAQIQLFAEQGQSLALTRAGDLWLRAKKLASQTSRGHRT